MNALYQSLVEQMLQHQGVEESTMMSSHCLRCQGNFFAMWFEREDSLIVKLPAERVQELVDKGKGKEFNFTGKRFKEWVLIPENADNHLLLVEEALQFAMAA